MATALSRTKNHKKCNGSAKLWWCTLVFAWISAEAQNVAVPGKKRLAVNDFPFVTPWLTGLEKLPDEFSPTGTKWTNSIAACAVMKDENVTDVKEWLQYYQWLGVDHVFLFDNDSADKSIIDQLRPHFSSLYVTFSSVSLPRAQLMVYAQCMEEYRERFNWMMFFDLDEYLVVRDRRAGGLKTVLDDYKQHGGVSVHWIFVGPGGRQHRAEHGGVLRDYQKCVPTPTARVKTIGNTWFLDGTSIHPHNHHYRDGVLAVNEKHEPLEATWKLKPGVSRRHPGFKRGNCPTQPDLCMHIPTWQHEPASVERLALFHYATKSYEDFQVKMKRGSGMSPHVKTMSYLEDIAREETDDPICKEAAAAAHLCCRLRHERLMDRSTSSSLYQ